MKKLTETDYLIESLDNGFVNSRYNGGWAKTVTGLDKSKSNGFSIKGDFVDGGKEGIYRVCEGCLYLDCDIQGSRKNQSNEYTLFTLEEGNVKILYKMSNYRNEKKHWATEFWPFVEEFLNKSVVKKARSVSHVSDLAKISTQDVINELKFRGYNVDTLLSHINQCDSAKNSFRALELE